jgi:hypothetical protein
MILRNTIQQDYNDAEKDGYDQDKIEQFTARGVCAEDDDLYSISESAHELTIMF